MKYSIITVNYNDAHGLKETIDSVISQTCHDYEYIIIDGGSTDGTCGIIKSYSEHISYTVSEPDKGIYDAWNKGVKMAKGKWIAFIGADDVLLPNAIKAYNDAILKTKDIDEYDYICAHNEYVDLNGRILKILGEEPKWSVMKKEMAPAHVASLHSKKNLFDTIGDYDYENFHICADYELLMRKKDKLKYLMLPFHIARMKVGGMSFSTKAIKESYRIRKYHHSLPIVINELQLLRDWFAYKFFIIRKSLIGCKIN